MIYYTPVRLEGQTREKRLEGQNIRISVRREDQNIKKNADECVVNIFWSTIRRRIRKKLPTGEFNGHF